jgi:hypothetical protein
MTYRSPDRSVIPAIPDPGPELTTAQAPPLKYRRPEADTEVLPDSVFLNDKSPRCGIALPARI